jgi:5'-nucleotidase
MNARVHWLTGAVLAGLAAFVACSSGQDVAPPAPALDGGGDGSLDTSADAGDEPLAARGTADIVLLSLSDWRGQVDPLVEPDGSGIPQRYGGLPALVTYFTQERAASPTTFLFSSGDAFGSTPLVSSATGDVLAAKGLSLMGVNAAALGPHELDRGTAQLSALLDVGTFRVTSTNLENVVQVLGPRPVTPFLLVDIGTGDASAPIKMAILGLTDWALADLQFPANRDEIKVSGDASLAGTAATANEAAANARLIGADVVVALANIGASVDTGSPPAGPLIELAGQLKGIDVLFGGETDRAFAEAVGNVFVVQNRNKGRTYARVLLHVDAKTPRIVTAGSIIEPLAYEVVRPVCDAATCTCPVASCPDQAHACNSVTGLCEKEVVPADKGAQALVQAAIDQLGTVQDTAIAVGSDAFPADGTSEQTEETALGDLVADAMRLRYAADVALIPGARLGAGLPSPYKAPASLNRASPPYDLVVGDVEQVLAQDESAVVRHVTGQMLWQILGHSIDVVPAKGAAFLQVSGLSFTYAAAPDAGARLESVTLDGGKVVPANDATTYTVVMTEPLSRGGLGYSFLAELVPTLTRELVTDVLVEYMKAKSPLSAPKTFTRIVKVP